MDHIGLQNSVFLVVFLPLVGSLISGLWAKKIGRKGAHSVTIGLLFISLVLSLFIFHQVVYKGLRLNHDLFTWVLSGNYHFNVGFLLDPLTSVMLVVVTFVSLLVHVYSIGYMKDDLGYQRFFCYMSLFTFAMLVLVTANNFFQLFFGWEGVGLVSYLLIGFWFTKDSAASGSLKAFLINRVGDFGFIIGVAAVLSVFGTLDYANVFSQVGAVAGQSISLWPGMHCSVITLICIFLFIGAMGKSAQVPLHVWLPESMEGPTPISALIHAATMVTAGVFMLARVSPLLELSITARSLVLIVGATGALFLGILAFTENDIKRVIAYSTMSQLGYMMAANGASAYAAAIFHLATHACFKALLFLGAGSIIVAMHHEQDLRKMGGLRKYLPLTYVCFLIGSLSLVALPPLSGFYSKEAIIEAVHLSKIPGAYYAYICLLSGAFVTAFYTFRAFFMAFHGPERMDAATRLHLKEHPIMTVPLMVLAVPSVILGGIFVNSMLFSAGGLLGDSIFVLPQNDVLAKLSIGFHGVWAASIHALSMFPFWLTLAGILMSWVMYVARPGIPVKLKKSLSWVNYILVNQYGFDTFNDWFFVRGSRSLSEFFYSKIDMVFIDGGIVNGVGRFIMRISSQFKIIQTGYIYHYVFVMLVTLILFLLWFIY